MNNSTRICNHCREERLLSSDNFKQLKPYIDGRQRFEHRCRPCCREYERNRVRTKYAEMTEKQKQVRRDATQRHRRKLREQKICECGAKATSEIFCSLCLDKKRLDGTDAHMKRRKAVFDHYGWRCSCVGCNETRVEFLTVDHIGEWGKNHRTPSGRKMTGRAIIQWIVSHNFPDTIRILCYNCNCARAHRGYCPHEVEQTKVVDDPLSVTGTDFIIQRFSTIQ